MAGREVPVAQGSSPALPKQRDGLKTVPYIAVAVLLLIVGPPFLTSYWVGLLTQMVIFAILAMSLDILLGYTGLPSLGHAGIFGVAAYVVAVLSTTYHAGFWVSVASGIVIGAVVGMRSTEKEMIYLVQSMGANELTTFLKIRLPRALPSIFGGLKVGMGQAVVGATVGEFIAAESGLGYLQLISQVRLDTTLLFAAVVVLSLLGVLLFNIVAWIERLALPWNRLRTEMIE